MKKKQFPPRISQLARRRGYRGWRAAGNDAMGNKKFNFRQVFAGQVVGIKEVQDHIWLVSSMDYDLGYVDLETRVLEPLENPFGPKLSPIRPVRSVTHVSESGLL